jgi:TPR repeat protein
MKATLRTLLVAAVGAVALSASAAAQEPVDVDQVFSQGLAAFERGDFATALGSFRLRAEQGDADAQYFLGHMFAAGKGVPENDAEAVRWYGLAAEQGDALAQFMLGSMYANGEGVPENDVKAVKWYRLAAEQGLRMAQTMLGYEYVVGERVRQNYVEAYKWLALAAAKGDAAAKEARDMVRGEMTPAQIAEAQKLAAEWKPKK